MAEGATTGPGWSGSRVYSVMERMGLRPQRMEPEAGDDLRIIAGVDLASQLTFGAIYFAEPGDGMSYLSLIALIPAEGLSEAAAKRIDARLSIATAFIDEGHLCIFAELNTAPAFTEDYFRAQVDFFLSDLRLGAQLLFGAGDMSFRAVQAFKAVRQRRGDGSPMVRALLNGGDREVFSASAETCPRCGGSGKRMLRPCRECFGTGEKR